MNWRSTICFSLCALAVGVLCAACGTTGDTDEADGGFEAGNPPAPTTTRSLKGEVERRDASAATRLIAVTAASETCTADAVVAASSEAEESVEIDEDGAIFKSGVLCKERSSHFTCGIWPKP